MCHTLEETEGDASPASLHRTEGITVQAVLGFASHSLSKKRGREGVLMSHGLDLPPAQQNTEEEDKVSTAKNPWLASFNGARDTDLSL